MQGWIKLHRKIVDWEWYSDLTTFKLFIHMLLKANHEETKWRGQTIEKGTFVTSLGSLSSETGLSIKQVRTGLKNLEKTGEIGKQTTNRNTLIIIVNYERYQEFEDKQGANSGQSRGKQRATNKNDKNDKNEENNLTISNDIVCQTETVRLDIRPVVDAWNSLSDYGIKPISKMRSTSTRYKMLCARIKEYGEDKILKAIGNIKHSDFLQGKSKEFIITFDWFVKPNNFPKVLEGNYENRDANNNYVRY